MASAAIDFVGATNLRKSFDDNRLRCVLGVCAWVLIG